MSRLTKWSMENTEYVIIDEDTGTMDLIDKVGQCEDIEVIDDEPGDIEEEPKKEMVNHPNHYGGDTPYECIKVLKNWLTEEQFAGFCLGNTLKKADFYLDYYIKTLEEKK